MIWLWAVSAALAVDCRPIDDITFRGLVLEGEIAVTKGDVAGHANILEDLESRIPCMQFAPEPRSWASYLVSRAIFAFYREEDWQTPLTAALRIAPDIDRGVGPAHPMYSWEPPQQTPQEPVPLPNGAEHIFVNGRAASNYPPSEGLVLVQREDDGWWKTRLLIDERIEESWLGAPVKPPPRIKAWGMASLQAQVIVDSQQRVGWWSDYVQETERGTGVGGVDLRGGATFLSPAGIHARIVVPGNLDLDATGGELNLAATWAPDLWHVGVGVGFTSQQLILGRFPSEEEIEAGENLDVFETTVLYILRYPMLTAGVKSKGRWKVDGTTYVGWRPYLTRLILDGGLSLKTGQVRVRVGLELGGSRAGFVRTRIETTSDGDELVEEDIRLWSVRTALKLGIVFGDF